MRLHGGAPGKRDQLIHRPLVIGMRPIFHRFDLPGRRDQKVAREAERASREPKAKMTMRHPANGGAQGLECEKPKRRFDAKFFVEGILRIANQVEWNILLHIPITVCHLPPGTSKWNKIERRLFAYISIHWRGRPLVDFHTIVSLIGATSTTTGLTVTARLDLNTY